MGDWSKGTVPIVDVELVEVRVDQKDWIVGYMMKMKFVRWVG